MESLLHDLRFGVRMLLKEKSFTAAALLTLALCIGANSAIFTVMNAVVLRDLPYEESERIVSLYNGYPGANVERAANSAPDYPDRRALTKVFEEVALYQYRGLTVGESGVTERLLGLRVTPSWLTVLRTAPVQGRGFLEEEGDPANRHRVLLTWGYWQEDLGGDPAAVGSLLRIDGEQYEVVGILPEEFRFEQPDIRLLLPLALSPEQLSVGNHHSNQYSMIARLQEGVTVEGSQARIEALNQEVMDMIPGFREMLENAGYHTVVRPYKDEIVNEVGSTLSLFQAAVLLVLLIGCVNIANLILVRNNVRFRELGTRFALGAGRNRMVRQLLTESLLLALVGGALGMVVGWGGLRLLTGIGLEELPRSAEIALDGSTLAATLGFTLFAGILFGAIPIVGLLRGDLGALIRQGSRSGTTSRRSLAVRSTLVVAQVSLAFALLVGAALMLVTFSRTAQVETGFEPDRVLTASVALPPTRYQEGAQILQFMSSLQERIRALPGVLAAGGTSIMPFSGDYNASVITAEGYELAPGESPIAPVNAVITTGYLDAMGIRVLSGRGFTEADREDSEPVVLVDEWLAERFWPGEDPIGKRLFQGVYGMPDQGEIEMRKVVGLVKNVKVTDLARDRALGSCYFPFQQMPRLNAYLAVRAGVEPETLTDAIRGIYAELDPDLPLYGVMTMQERIAESLLSERSRMTLLSIFAGVALFLALVGIYGVLAYAVTLRTREIGIRMALGSAGSEIFRLVLRQGVRLLLVGLLIGIAGSALLTRLLQSMLFGVSATDSVVFGLVTVSLGAAAFLACLLPARRATRVDPVVALKYE